MDTATANGHSQFRLSSSTPEVIPCGRDGGWEGEVYGVSMMQMNKGKV